MPVELRRNKLQRNAASLDKVQKYASPELFLRG
jgi:hypothetical protein